MERRGENMAETPAFGAMNNGLLAMDNPHIADEKGGLVQEAGLMSNLQQSKSADEIGVLVQETGLYMYICIYVYMYICIYIHTYIHTHTSVYIYIHTYMHMYIYTYI